MEQIQQFFAGKVLFVTGATGLLGKVLVEKILRDLPEVSRIYLLIRPKTLQDGTKLGPQERLRNEFLSSSAFNQLKQDSGENFQRLIEEKIIPVEGDLSQESLGLDPDDRKRLKSEVQIIINCAAVVSFDAPLDSAVVSNVLGPKRVLEFAHEVGTPVVAHVSTCFVNGTRTGRIAEEPLDPQTALDPPKNSRSNSYDVDREIQTIQNYVVAKQIESKRFWRRSVFVMKSWWVRNTSQANDRVGREEQIERARQSWLENSLIVAGLKWARFRGWSDTYTFTKAMGEQMLMRYRADLPVVVIRPAIIEGGIKSPEPGWLDGFRMLDPLVVAYGRGALPDFPGNPQTILDIVPADIVVNALLAIIPEASPRNSALVYHVASGMENPITLKEFTDLVRGYFCKEGLTRRGPVSRALPEITFPSRRKFLRRIRTYLFAARLSEKCLALLLISRWGKSTQAAIRSRRNSLERLEYYVRIYGPYAEVRCQYLTHQVRRVWGSLSSDDQLRFPFDVTAVKWKEYIQDIYIPGIKRFLLGIMPTGEGLPRSKGVDRQLESIIPEIPVDEVVIGRHSELEGLLENHQIDPPEHRTIGLGVRVPSEKEMDKWARPGRGTYWARSIFRWFMGFGFRHYLGFTCEGVEYVPTNEPFIVATNHSSHLDAGAVLVALKNKSNSLKPMAAQDYFFRNRWWGWAVYTFMGAIPFDRHSHAIESLGLGVGLLRKKHSLIVFPEGGRSLTGKIQTFKGGIGLLALECEAPIIPASIIGTFDALPKGRFFLKRHPVSVRFGPVIRVGDYRATFPGEGSMELSRRIAADTQRAVEALC